MSDPFADPRRLLERVYGYVAYVIGDEALAQDVTSEAVARGLRYRASYDPGKGTPAAWLIGIARNCMPAEAAPTADETALLDMAAPGDIELETVDRLTVRAAVATLAAHDRELLALRYGSDLTARQIAGLLEMQVNAVEVALHRALTRLRTAYIATTSELSPACKGFGRTGDR